MADYSCQYTISGPSLTITLNNGELGNGSRDNLYWIGDIDGLDGPPIRAQVDNAPQTDGGIVHTFWKGPRHINFQGDIIIQSVPFGGPCLEERNEMEDALRGVLESIIREDGTLSWIPTGQFQTRSLTVRHDVPLDFSPTNNYMTQGFVFGLVAANSDWTLA
jgi:hypothetical protein